MPNSGNDTIIDTIVAGRNLCVMDADLKDYNDKVITPVKERVTVLERKKIAIGGFNSEGTASGIEDPAEVVFDSNGFEVVEDPTRTRLTIKSKGGGGGSAAPSNNLFIGIFDTLGDLAIETSRIISDGDFNKKMVGWVRKNVSGALPPVKAAAVELSAYKVYLWKAGSSDPAEANSWDISEIPLKGHTLTVVGPLSPELTYWRPVAPSGSVGGYDWSSWPPETHDGQIVCYAERDNYKFYYSNGTAWRTYGLGSIKISGFNDKGTSTSVDKAVELSFSDNFKITTGPDSAVVDTRGLKYGNINIHKVKQGAGINLSIDAADGNTLLMEVLGGSSSTNVFLGIFDYQDDLLAAARKYPDALRSGKVTGFLTVYWDISGEKELMYYKVMDWSGVYTTETDIDNLANWSVREVNARGQAVTIVGPRSRYYKDWTPDDPRTKPPGWGSYIPDVRDGQLVCYAKDISDTNTNWLYYYSDGGNWRPLITEEGLRYPPTLESGAPHEVTDVNKVKENEWRVITDTEVITKFPDQFAASPSVTQWKAESCALQTIHAAINSVEGSVQRMTGLTSGHTWERVKNASFKGTGTWSQWTMLHEKALESLGFEFKDGLFPDDPSTPDLPENKAILWRYKFDSGVADTWKLFVYKHELKGDKGDPGEKGDTGKGLIIKGVVNSKGDLTSPSLSPSPTLYDLFLVRPTNEVWMWFQGDSHQTLSNWQNLGKVAGIKGDRGPRGYTGATGPSGSVSAFMISWITSTITNQVGTQMQIQLNNGLELLENQVANLVTSAAESAVDKAISDAWDELKGDKGEKGDKGDDGDKGADGKSFQIVGSYSLLTLFQSQYPLIHENVGKAAIIGKTDGSEVRRLWGITESMIGVVQVEDFGDFQGPQGNPGRDATWTISLRDKDFVGKGPMFEVPSDVDPSVASLYIQDSDSIIFTGIAGASTDVGFKASMKYPIPELVKPSDVLKPSTAGKLLSNNGNILQWVDLEGVDIPTPRLLLSSPAGKVFGITVDDNGRLDVTEVV